MCEHIKFTTRHASDRAINVPAQPYHTLKERSIDAILWRDDLEFVHYVHIPFNVLCELKRRNELDAWYHPASGTHYDTFLGKEVKLEPPYEDA